MENILYTLLSVIVFFIVLINLSKAKPRLAKLTLFVFITELIVLLIFSIPSIELLASFLVTVSMSIFLYTEIKSKSMSILFAIIASILCFTCDNLAMVVATPIFSISIFNIRNNWLHYGVTVGICYTSAFFISKYLGNFMERKLKILSVDLKSKFSIYIMIGAILTLLLFYVNVFLSGNIDSSTIIILSSILLVLYFIFLIISIYTFMLNIMKSMEITFEQEQLNTLKEYTNNLENLYTEMRKFRHDHVNILGSVYGHIEKGDINGLKQYFSEHIIGISDRMTASNTTIDRLKNIKLPELKGLLSLKLMHAQESNIDVHIEVAEDITAINFYIVDLCRVIGILIDNAIEACLEAELPKLKFAAFTNNGSVVLIIANTFLPPPPKIEIMFEKGYSTKGNNRGLGLFNLKEIIGKYKNIYVETSITDDELMHKLIITNSYSKGNVT